MSKYRIQRYQVPAAQTLITIAADDDEIVSSTFELNGILKGFEIDPPDLDDTDTFTITLKNAQGGTVFTKASIPEIAPIGIYTDANNRPIEVPLHGNYTLTITASSAQAANRQFDVEILVDRRV